MNKRKQLFAPEDFDKPQNPSPAPKTKNWLWGIVAAVVVVACVIGFVQLKPSASSGKGDGSVAVTADSTTEGNADSVQAASNLAEANTASASTDENAAETVNAKVEEASTVATEEPAVPSQKPSSSAASVATSDSRTAGSVEHEARQVIRGTYGNGSVRKQKLGNRYSEIQSKVNDMYRNGQVY